MFLRDVQSKGSTGALPEEDSRHFNARAAALHSTLGLIEYHAEAAAAECCTEAADALLSLLRLTAAKSVSNLVQTAVVYTGGTTADAEFLMAPLVESLRSE